MPAKKFQSVLERGGASLGWTVARVPFDPRTVWKQMVRLRVRGTINGFAFRTSLFPQTAVGLAGAPGEFVLLVNKAMQSGAGVALGDKAEFALEPDLEERAAELPDELAALLDEEPGLRAFYDEMSEYARREIGKWIVAVKSDASRLSRAEQMAERLLSTMEAERTLPPAIASALGRNAKARAGWEKMSPTQRRNEIFAVFYYRTPEARAKRIETLCATAAKKAT